MTYFECVHGIVKRQDDGTYRSWRGGVYRLKDVRPVTAEEFRAELSNSRHYPPDQAATAREWYEDWTATTTSPIEADRAQTGRYKFMDKDFEAK